MSAGDDLFIFCYLYGFFRGAGVGEKVAYPLNTALIEKSQD